MPGTPDIDSAVAGASSSAALAANPDRLYAVVCNLDSTEGVHVNIGAPAEVGKGWYIPPGGNLPISVTDPQGRDVWATQAINTIRAGGTDVDLSTSEVTRWW